MILAVLKINPIKIQTYLLINRSTSFISRLIFIIPLIFCSSCSVIESSDYLSELTAPKLGGKAPNFSLSDVDGNTIILSEFQGHVVILTFWVTWCGPCRSEMPYMQELFDGGSIGNLTVLGVNVQEPIADVEAYGKELGLTFPLLLDYKGKVSKTYQVNAYPTTYFINPEGIIKYIKVGSMSKEEMVSILSENDLFSLKSTSENPTSEQGSSLGDGNVANQLTGCVTSTALNARAGPGVNFTVIGGFVHDECFNVDARNSDSTWLRLSQEYIKNGQRFWVASKYVELDGNIKDLKVVSIQ